ncbi:MAG: Hsp33 family molecular chaperone HslO [Gammaproteobacteria bacterium]|nr:Hsp33 family molecular chaperone HslO [Gammaproteobacteria bacterium]
MSVDSITPFGFESIPVRGSLIHLSRSWRRMLRDHDYDDLVTETLGHATAATALTAQSLKFDGAITLQIQRGKALQMLVVQCTSELELRGMAVIDPNEKADNFAELTRDAHCAVTVDAGDRPYQGIVEVSNASLAASLERYFARSVQVPSHIALVANEKIAGGILLQQVPGESIREDDWSRLHYLAETLACRDFKDGGGLPLIGRLFAEDDVRVYRPRQVSFRCRCTARKTEDVLKMLGETEAREVLSEQGGIDVTCEYCGRRRHFDAVDIERLFADNVVVGPDSVQ